MIKQFTATVEIKSEANLFNCGKTHIYSTAQPGGKAVQDTPADMKSCHCGTPAGEHEEAEALQIIS